MARHCLLCKACIPEKFSCVVLPVFCKVFLVRWYADEDFFVSIYTLNFEISSVGIKVITAHLLMSMYITLYLKLVTFLGQVFSFAFFVFEIVHQASNTCVPGSSLVWPWRILL